VWIVVFRHHPGLVLDMTREQREAHDRDEKTILKAAKDRLRGYEYGGNLASGYELSIHARDRGRWKAAVNKLLKDGALKHSNNWGLGRNGYGLVPVRSPPREPYPTACGLSPERHHFCSTS
jgi:hypothetical protein